MLLVWMIVAITCKKSSSFLNKVLSYMAFFVAFANAIYSALTDDVTTISCFFKDQVIKLLIDLQ